MLHKCKGLPGDKLPGEELRLPPLTFGIFFIGRSLSLGMGIK